MHAHTPKLMLLLVASLVTCAAGCACERPMVSGSPFTHEGTAVIRGAATIPAGIGDGLHIQFLVGTGGARYGVLPDDLFDMPETCGTGMDYEITQVEGGTYDIYIEITDSGQEDPEFEGLASSPVTVTDGETVEVDLTFEPWTPS